MALKEKNRAGKPEREGDVLGISSPNPNATIPKPPDDGGSPEGIDVRDRATGIGDLHRSKGATGIDMGAGGSGTDVTRHPSRPKSAEDAEE